MSADPTTASTSPAPDASWTDYADTGRNVDYLRQLDAASRAPTLRTHFPEPYETNFRRDIRLMFGRIRAWMALAAVLIFGSSPLWGPPTLNPPRDVIVLIRLLEFGLILPFCLSAAWLQWRQPERLWSERVFMFAFLATAIGMEWLRHSSAALGFHMNPSLSSCVLVGFIVIGRVPLRAAAAFIAVYLASILLFERFHPLGDSAARSPMDWVVETVFLIIVFAGSLSNELYMRRTWAARQLLKALAYFDPLTKLPNRRAFEQHYEAVARQARRDDRRLFVGLIDMDHFKNVNDRYGHEYGDGVLVEMGVVLGTFARRPLDMAARLGGEEFAVVLYDCSRADGQRRMEELRRQVESLQIANEGTALGYVTMSAGGLAVSADTELAEAYRLADDALYVAKRGGRNQTVIGSPRVAEAAEARAVG